MQSTQNRVRLTAGRVESFACKLGKTQTFLWDTEAPALALRATPTGRKTYVFESRLHGATIRINIGTVADWPIEQARVKAQGMKMMVDNGTDPREVERDRLAVITAKKVSAVAHALTVGEVWPRYLAEGRPKRRNAWKPGYRADLDAMAAPGGKPKKRGKGLTRPGPIYPLLALCLSAVNEDALKIWYDTEAKASNHQAARALMMFRGFLRWASSKPEYRSMVDRSAGRAAAILESLPQVTKRTDCLEAAQLPGWFVGTGLLKNRHMAAYIGALLLTGARREEMAALKWADVDFQWSRLTLADKIEPTRTIPLTPYLAQQLDALPRVSGYVFATKSKQGHIADPRASLTKVRRHAGIHRLTVHGLRRSFSLLGESAGAPAGAIAQVMGHKPSATAEGYRPRSVDALRPYLLLIEKHILEQAGVVFVPDAERGKPRLVATA